MDGKSTHLRRDLAYPERSNSFEAQEQVGGGREQAGDARRQWLAGGPATHAAAGFFLHVKTLFPLD
jgi:hypothetical protein